MKRKLLIRNLEKKKKIICNEPQKDKMGMMKCTMEGYRWKVWQTIWCLGNEKEREGRGKRNSRTFPGGVYNKTL